MRTRHSLGIVGQGEEGKWGGRCDEKMLNPPLLFYDFPPSPSKGGRREILAVTARERREEACAVSGGEIGGRGGLSKAAAASRGARKAEQITRRATQILGDISKQWGKGAIAQFALPQGRLRLPLGNCFLFVWSLQFHSCHYT